MTTTAIAASRLEHLSARLQNARRRSEDLFAAVRPEALYDRPIPERHRIIFYLGHLEAFDWNLLRDPLGLKSHSPEFDNLFAFGIDPVDGGLPTDQPKDWPSIEEVRRYNGSLRQALDGALAKLDESTFEQLGNGQLLEVAIEHRLMHAETLCYMLHQLPVERKSMQPSLAPPVAPRVSQRSVEIPAGNAILGMPRIQNGTFGWDNEFEENEVHVPAFSIDTYNVTNQDFLRFVLAGGYRERKFWSDEGWQSLVSQQRQHPVFWAGAGNNWKYGAMFEEISLPLEWPVYVSHDEASAYARWSGKELPSEAEWHRAAFATRDGSARLYPWGENAPASRHGNFDFDRWDPVAVGSFPGGSSDYGVADLAGNGWEWTRTPFEPFPGFQPFPFYPGYSANFFDGKHFVMKGGSPRTPACMLRRSFRNWFQPHYPYVYASFRCVER